MNSGELRQVKNVLNKEKRGENPLSNLEISTSTEPRYFLHSSETVLPLHM
jgi:hypothetical protein